MCNNDLLKIVNENEKVALVLGLYEIDKKNDEIIEKFIKKNFGVSKKDFNKSIGNEPREEFFPILEKEYSKDFPLVYINRSEINKLKFLKEIKKEIFCTPIILFVKKGFFLPIKYSSYNTYQETKKILEDFKNNS